MSKEPVTKSSIPEIDVLEKAILEVLKSGRQRSFTSAEKEVATFLSLSTAQKKYCVAGSTTALYSNRLKKARAVLHEAGLIEIPQHGKVKISSAGKLQLEKRGGLHSADGIPGNIDKVAGQVPSAVAEKSAAHAKATAPSERNIPSTSGETLQYAPPAVPQSAVNGGSAKNSSDFDAMPIRSQNSAFSLKQAKTSLLPLVLAIIAILLSLFKPLAVLGILCGAASLFMLFKAKKAQSSTTTLKAPKTTIGLGVCSVLIGLCLAIGGPATPSNQETFEGSQDKTENVATLTSSASEKEAAKLSFEVVAQNWPQSKGPVTVCITYTNDKNETINDYYEANPGSSYVLEYAAGAYAFAIDTASLSNETTSYKADTASYAYDGTTGHAVKIRLSEDTTAKDQEKAEKEALAKQKAAEEAAATQADQDAAAKAEADAAAVAAAAAAASTSANGNGVESSDATVYTTNTGSKYHADGCKHLAKSKIAISLADAQAQGLTPCKTCNP